jgi:hypothetical protein
VIDHALVISAVRNVTARVTTRSIITSRVGRATWTSRARIIDHVFILATDRWFTKGVASRGVITPILVGRAW